MPSLLDKSPAKLRFVTVTHKAEMQCLLSRIMSHAEGHIHGEYVLRHGQVAQVDLCEGECIHVRIRYADNRTRIYNIDHNVYE